MGKLLGPTAAAPQGLTSTFAILWRQKTPKSKCPLQSDHEFLHMPDFLRVFQNSEFAVFRRKFASRHCPTWQKSSLETVSQAIQPQMNTDEHRSDNRFFGQMACPSLFICV